MVTSEKESALRTLSGERDATVLRTYLKMAEEVLLNKMYPFGYGCENVEIPKRYWFKQVQLANIMLAKRGAEGESAHNENGINRTYEGMDEILKDVTPYGGVFG